MGCVVFVLFSSADVCVHAYMHMLALALLLRRTIDRRTDGWRLTFSRADGQTAGAGAGEVGEAAAGVTPPYARRHGRVGRLSAAAAW